MPELKIKAGIVGVGYKGYSLDYVDKITKRVADDIEKTGLYILKKIPKIESREDGLKVAKSFNSNDFDLVIVVIATWVDARGIITFLRQHSKIPVLFYSTGGRTDKRKILISPASGAGAPGILEPVRQIGVKYEYIYEEPDTETKVDEINSFAKVAHCIKMLPEKKLGSFGFSDMGLYTTNFDNTLLRNIYEVETDFIDLFELEKESEKVSEKDVTGLMNRLRAEWRCVGRKPDDLTLQKLCKYYYGLKKIIKKKNLSAISIKCVEGMMVHMNFAPCMIGTLVGDESPFICECDVPGMLGHVILNSISGKTVTFVESYEFFKDRVLFGVCGFLPESMIEGQKKLKLFKTTPWEGVMNCSEMKTGDVTLIRPFFRDGKPFIHLVTGKAVKARKWLEIGFDIPGMHPSIEIILDSTIEHFLENVPAQHFSLVFGDYSKEIKIFSKLKGINLIYENMKKKDNG